MVSDENHEFLFDVTARSEIRVNSEISELLTARRMDITVWMSSPNDEVPAVAEAGSDTGGSRWTASPDGPGAALGGSMGFGLPYGLEAGREAAAGGVGLFPARSGMLFRSRGGATGLLGLGLL
ncbi:hypothetical protein EVAR_6490_1 [Eumeta japonica]|uniref:Uncharacterized protein n=1 Tax=Eumeta variegata TaxID=151549 RepID=A0A4C1SQ33_EUMVA|nr:hypothetical protein EVAR_6490_1 [Eumeta japonica]